MKHKNSKWWFILFVCGFLGTIVGAAFNEYYNYQWVIGSIVLFPFSLLIRIVAGTGSILFNSGISIWSTPLWNALDIACIITTVSVSVLYFRTEKYLWLILFGIAFGVLNIGNYMHFVALMSI